MTVEEQKLVAQAEQVGLSYTLACDAVKLGKQSALAKAVSELQDIKIARLERDLATLRVEVTQ